jgi:hypothetical protein
VKIRVIAELLNALDTALAWRKQEITNVRFLVAKARDHDKPMLKRLAVLILYAHWEGFAKQAGEYYLQLVERQGLAYEELQSNFLALGGRNAIREAGQSKRMQLYINVVEFATFNQGNKAKFPYKGAFDLEDNLNSDVLTNLLTTIGVVCDDFFTSRFLIMDGSLLRSRNAIAHGERFDVDDETYEQLHRLVLELLEHLKTQIENSAAIRSFVRA